MLPPLKERNRQLFYLHFASGSPASIESSPVDHQFAYNAGATTFVQHQHQHQHQQSVSRPSTSPARHSVAPSRLAPTTRVLRDFGNECSNPSVLTNFVLVRVQQRVA